LIQLILAASTLPLDKLGYDTIMTPISIDVKEPYKSVWEVKMPRKGSIPGETDTYILFRALSLTAGGVICGRAPRIWLARRKYDDSEGSEVILELLNRLCHAN
jgi:hypothetical protein